MKPGLKDECIRLRVEESLSFRDIEARTGASKGSLSLWLKPYPVTVAQKPRNPETRSTKKDRGLESEVHQIATTSGLTANQKGQVAELAIQLKLALRGFEVFGATTDGSKADWVVRVPATGKMWSLQVKLALKGPGGLPYIQLRCAQSKAKYQPHDFDFLVGYDLFTDTAYIWDWSDLSNRGAVTITPEAAERWDKFQKLN